MKNLISLFKKTEEILTKKEKISQDEEIDDNLRW